VILKKKKGNISVIYLKTQYKSLFCKFDLNFIK